MTLHFLHSGRVSSIKPEIYLYREHIDFRMGMNRLAEAVHLVMKENPLSGSYYVFINRRKNGVKVLYWDRNGFCLWQKRLEKARFHWPVHLGEGEKLNLTEQQFLWILEGYNLKFWKPHPELKFEKIV